MAKTYINENEYRCFSNSGKQVSRWVGKMKDIIDEGRDRYIKDMQRYTGGEQYPRYSI